MSHTHSPGPGAGELWTPTRRVRRFLAAVLVPLAALTVAGLIVLWPSHRSQPVPLQFTTFGEGTTVYEPGRVIAASQQACGPAAGGGVGNGKPTVCGTASVALSGGPDAGRTVTIDSGGANLAVGDQVRLSRGPVTDPATGARTYQLDDYVRDAPLGIIAALFAGLLYLIARWRGLAALLGVGVAAVVLVEFMLPALLEGHSPVAVAVTGSAAILFVVLYLAHGVSARTSTALLGTLAALGVTAGLAVVATRAAHLTGRSNETYNELQAAGLHLSITGLILCGLIVGALGVLNDVTVTQASAVWELSAADPRAGWQTLFTSGMRIGRDHIASTIYTLVFAYTGVALPLLLLLNVSGRSGHDLITGDEIGGEIVRDLVGAAGLTLAVPLTTLIAAVIAARPHQPTGTSPEDLLTAGDPGR